jgi:2-haloacid dehalogenase
MTAAVAASSLLSSRGAAANAPPAAIKAVAFDGFAIFNPGPVFALAEELFPGHGAALGNAWRTRQFEYTWLRNSIGRYVDFWHVTQDALKYAAAQTHLDLSAEQSEQLMNAFLVLKPWPDVLPVLESLKRKNMRLALLSNLTPMMMQSCVKASGLNGLFEAELSTDRVRAFKPDPRTYNMGLEVLHLSRAEIAFVAFAGWDAVGAKTFGYPTYWANRLKLPVEELGMKADAACNDLSDLPGFIVNTSKGRTI